MRKKGLVFIAAILVLAGAAPGVLQAEPPVMKTLAAHVVNVAEDGSSLFVDFRHPATEKVHRLVFRVDEQTGFSGIKGLKDLRAGQVVSIDYMKGKNGWLFIRSISKVQLSGPPAGLEKFHGI